MHRAFFRGLAAILLLSSPALHAQSAPFRATELANFDEAGSKYADVWADGDTAIVAHWEQNEVDIFDVSNPTNPIKRSTFVVPSPDTSASAQDVKTARIGGRLMLFIALEAGFPNGALIVDIEDPSNPTLLTRLDPEPGSFERIHNLYYDQGWLYLVNSDDPTIAIVDLRNYDPLNPPSNINNWAYRLTGVSDSFVHDITVRNGILYASGWDSLVTYDVSNLGNSGPSYLGEVPGVASHSVWVTDDGQYVVTAEERSAGPMRLYKVTDNGSSLDFQYVDSYLENPNAAFSVHNPVMIGDRIYASYYQVGTIVMEIDRTNDTFEKVASFDTSATAGSFDGSWGVYPFLGEEKVLLSDIQTGLWVVDMSTVAVSFPGPRPDFVNPGTTTTITVELTELGNAQIDPLSTFLKFRVNDGSVGASSFIAVGGDLYEAQLPAAACGSKIEWWIDALDTQGRVYRKPANPNLNTYKAYVANNPQTIFHDDFQVDTGGWVVFNQATLEEGAFERRAPLGIVAQPTGGDPNFSSAGLQCYITGGRPIGRDVDGGETRLISPVLDFSGGDGLITFSHWTYSNYHRDHFRIDIKNGGPWVTVEEFGYASGAWKRKAILVSDWVEPTATVQVRFVASDENENTTVECGVDEFRATRFECTPPAAVVFQNGSGVNPASFVSQTTPALGTTWDSTIDIATPGALFSLVTISAGGGIQLPTAFGELLINAPYLDPDVQTGAHSIAIPLNPALIGTTLHTQGSTFAPGDFRLVNGQELVFGY